MKPVTTYQIWGEGGKYIQTTSSQIAQEFAEEGARITAITEKKTLGDGHESW